jgi:hypothetical protein
MISMNIIMQGDNCWPDLADDKVVIHLGEGSKPIQVAVLDGGLKSGRPSVAIRTDLPDGTVVIAETTARLFVTAARAVLAKYPDLFEGD